jgi:type I restriction enzyme S subunit
VVTPAGWKLHRFGDILDYEQPTQYLVSSNNYVIGGKVPVLTAGKTFLLGFTDDSEGIFVDLPTILFDDFTTATQWVDFEFKVKSSACKMLTLKSDKFNLRYSFERLNALNYKISDHKRHWISEFQELEIWMPPLKEQEAIAEALSDADAAIESLEALIAKKRDIKQATMQQLLTGRTRIPGFSDKWQGQSLGQIASIKTGSRNNQDKNLDGQYPFFVRSAHVEAIDSYSYNGEAILIPGEGGIGEIFHYVNGPHEVHQRVYRISDFSSTVNAKFAYFYIRSFFGAHAMRNTVKATVDSLRLPTFLEFSLNLPSLKEQNAIAETLTSLDDELESLNRQILKLRMVKQGMMQDLLSGKVRLV